MASPRACVSTHPPLAVSLDPGRAQTDVSDLTEERKELPALCKTGRFTSAVWDGWFLAGGSVSSSPWSATQHHAPRVLVEQP